MMQHSASFTAAASESLDLAFFIVSIESRTLVCSAEEGSGALSSSNFTFAAASSLASCWAATRSASSCSFSFASALLVDNHRMVLISALSVPSKHSNSGHQYSLCVCLFLLNPLRLGLCSIDRIITIQIQDKCYLLGDASTQTPRFTRSTHSASALAFNSASAFSFSSRSDSALALMTELSPFKTDISYKVMQVHKRHDLQDPLTRLRLQHLSSQAAQPRPLLYRQNYHHSNSRQTLLIG
jgi:hypothetical protein